MYQAIQKSIRLLLLCFLLSAVSIASPLAISAASTDEMPEAVITTASADEMPKAITTASANEKPEAVTTASADEIPAAVTASGESVVRIILSCTDSKGNTYYIKQGTGFAAGSGDESCYILTARENVSASEKALSQIRRWGGLSSEDTLTTQVSILIEPDILIPATISSVGTDHPYALLAPSQKLNHVSALRFNSLENITRTQAAWLYGYNADRSLLGQTSLPKLAPSLQSGSITELSSEPLSISCDINGETGCSGAPLLDENGYVLGMFYSKNDVLEVLPADTILELLTALNISHETNSLNADYNVADDALKEELQTLVADCKQDVTHNGDSYSSKTLSSYMAAIETATEVLENTKSTKANYESAIKALKTAKKKLKPANFTFRVIQSILLGVLLLLALINLKQYLKSRKFNRTLHPAEAPAGKSGQVSSGALIRRSTGEIIRLEKKEFRIGSDKDKVDYAIPDNPAISRYHAAIIQKDNDYYLMDNNSTNHTSVNHTLLTPQSPCRLNDNDFILFANEPFTFRLL